MEERPRVIYDCSVFWRALFSPLGVGRDCVRLVEDGVVLHFMSDEILTEIRDVLTRPETLEKFSAVTVYKADAFIVGIVERSTLIIGVPRAFKLPRDPKDEPYIDLAAAVDASFLVTTDSDMLDLMTGIDVESKQFRQRFRGLKVVEPKEFLRIIAEKDVALRP